MSKKYIKRTVSCHAAEYSPVEDSSRRNSTLQDYVAEAHDKLSSKERTRKTDALTEIRSTEFRNTNDGFFFHITEYTPDGSISIVPKAEDKDETPVYAEGPKDDGDYLDNEAPILIYKNLIFICSGGISNTRISLYLTELLDKIGYLSEGDFVHINDIADIGSVERIRKYGVKSIQFNASLDRANWNLASRGGKDQGIKEKCAYIAQALFGEEGNEDVQRELEGYNLSLEFSVAKKRLDSSEENLITQRAIEAFNSNSLDALSDDIGFVIELNGDGGKIHSGEMTLRRKIRFSKLGSSIDLDRAYQELVAFKNHLQGEGTILTDEREQGE